MVNWHKWHTKKWQVFAVNKQKHDLETSREGNLRRGFLPRQANLQTRQTWLLLNSQYRSAFHCPRFPSLCFLFSCSKKKRKYDWELELATFSSHSRMLGCEEWAFYNFYVCVCVHARTHDSIKLWRRWNIRNTKELSPSSSYNKRRVEKKGLPLGRDRYQLHKFELHVLSPRGDLESWIKSTSWNQVLSFFFFSLFLFLFFFLIATPGEPSFAFLEVSP
jgi:hypothetical protein